MLLFCHPNYINGEVTKSEILFSYEQTHELGMTFLFIKLHFGVIQLWKVSCYTLEI
jgi:hypothetical protein